MDEQRMDRRIILVVGAGPGVSGSVARRFARGGFDVALLGVDSHELEQLSAEIDALGAKVDCALVDVTDEVATRTVIRNLGERVERIHVLHYNPSAYRERDPLELSVAELLEDVSLGVGGLLTAVQAARPYLGAGSRITVTGSMAADRPWHGAASLGVQKAGVRNLVHSFDSRLAADGIRAVSLTVQGTLAKDGPFAPDAVANAIWDAAHQDDDSWCTEVRHPV